MVVKEIKKGEIWNIEVNQLFYFFLLTVSNKAFQFKLQRIDTIVREQKKVKEPNFHHLLNKNQEVMSVFYTQKGGKQNTENDVRRLLFV